DDLPGTAHRREVHPFVAQPGDDPMDPAGLVPIPQAPALLMLQRLAKLEDDLHPDLFPIDHAGSMSQGPSAPDTHRPSGEPGGWMCPTILGAAAPQRERVRGRRM